MRRRRPPRVRILCIAKEFPPGGENSFWRRVWDSNPRGREPTRFSRPPRYDHFDNSPNIRLLKRAHISVLFFMAQKEGFEPSRAFYTPTPLAGEPLRPLGYFCTMLLKYNSMAHRLCQEVYYFELYLRYCLANGDRLFCDGCKLRRSYGLRRVAF